MAKANITLRILNHLLSYRLRACLLDLPVWLSGELTAVAKEGFARPGRPRAGPETGPGRALKSIVLADDAAWSMPACASATPTIRGCASRCASSLNVVSALCGSASSLKGVCCHCC